MERVTSVSIKRPLSSTINEDSYSSKREKKNEYFFKCSKCTTKIPIDRDTDYREHLQSHFKGYVVEGSFKMFYLFLFKYDAWEEPKFVPWFYSDNSRFKCGKCLKSFPLYDETVTHVTVAHQELACASDVIDSHSEENVRQLSIFI